MQFPQQLGSVGVATYIRLRHPTWSNPGSSKGGCGCLPALPHGSQGSLRFERRARLFESGGMVVYIRNLQFVRTSLCGVRTILRKSLPGLCSFRRMFYSDELKNPVISVLLAYVGWLPCGVPGCCGDYFQKIDLNAGVCHKFRGSFSVSPFVLRLDGIDGGDMNWCILYINPWSFSTKIQTLVARRNSYKTIRILELNAI